MKNILFALSISFLIACGNTEQNNGMPKQERLASIQQLEQATYSPNGDVNTTSLLALSNNYALYAKENPGDELSPRFLFKAGDISMGMEKGEQAIAHYEQIIEEYPQFDKVAYCYFLVGFVYENTVQDLEKAEEAYKIFIEKFPNHDMTESAKFSLKNLGKSPKELIREFEAQDTLNQVES